MGKSGYWRPKAYYKRGSVERSETTLDSWFRLNLKGFPQVDLDKII